MKTFVECGQLPQNFTPEFRRNHTVSIFSTSKIYTKHLALFIIRRVSNQFFASNQVTKMGCQVEW